jgi:DNA polymerase-3 subunit delta'
VLDDFSTGQPISYRLMKNIINSKQFNHAYLIQTNNYYKAEQLALAFAKALICLQGYTNNHECNNCCFCERIDNNNFPELKIIRPEELWIKKEEIIELQNAYSLKPLEGNKRVYIIYEPEKLNHQSANSLLKFLEEPQSNIIAILVTNNVQKIIKTIVSRCQIINLISNKLADYEKLFTDINDFSFLKLGLLTHQNEKELQKYLEDKENINKIKSVIEFISKLEKEYNDILLDINNLWHSYIKEKKDFIFAFNVIIFFYKDVINYLNFNKIEIFDEYQMIIKKIAANNDNTTLSRKLNKVISLKETITSNVNLNLLLDKLVISLGGV